MVLVVVLACFFSNQSSNETIHGSRGCPRLPLDRRFCKGCSLRNLSQPALEQPIEAISLKQATDSKLQVEVDVRGFQADELSVQTHGDVLTVEGNSSRDGSSTYFRRSVTLPAAVGRDALVSAVLQDGWLTVHLPAAVQTAVQTVPVQCTGNSAQGGSARCED